ncbi:T9SS type A sorting domain-containing protein, partial [candidate division KSB1 bacterium]|nr:T9SS type A sorting domain-containing protein [candidate division KSB1 bacterium]
VKVTSFFWPTLLYGYLTYNPAIHGNMSFSQKLRSGQQAGFQRMLQKQLSPAGAFLQKQIAAATAVTEKPAERPAGFALAQNYPNPFSASGTLGNSATVISFQLSVSSHVTLKVFEVNGREVATLVDDEMISGNHAVTFAPQGGDLAGGVYFYQLTAGKLSQTRKALLMK